MHVDIKDTTGLVYLPLITKEEINKNLSKIDPKIRSTLSIVHLSAIKILLKAEFQESIDSPIKMGLIDNIINDRRDCILGAARGNLAYQKFINTIVSSTNNLNQISGRCLPGIYNLLSFFGLSKDPSEKLSKSPSIHNRYYSFVKMGSDIEIEILRDIKKLLIKQNTKIEGLEGQISQLRNHKCDNEALKSKLNEIEEYLKKILG